MAHPLSQLQPPKAAKSVDAGPIRPYIPRNDDLGENHDKNRQALAGFGTGAHLNFRRHQSERSPA